MLDLRVKLKRTKRENNEQKQIVEKLSAAQEYKKKLLKQKELLRELFESTLDKAMKGEYEKSFSYQNEGYCSTCL